MFASQIKCFESLHKYQKNPKMREWLQTVSCNFPVVKVSKLKAIDFAIQQFCIGEVTNYNR